MLSVHKINNAANAAHYHAQKDDYYSKDSSASTRWSGAGVKQLGLVNGAQVDLEEFNKLLSGIVDKDIQVGGEKHMPGYDLTFSAPKSVSVLALAGGDSRVVEAHEKAVSRVLKKIEEEHIKTRIKDKDGNITVRDTESMIAAQFRHETSREAEAQLHSHCVIMNMTYDAETQQYRSLDGRALLNERFVKTMGQEYRNFLAEEIQRLGYDVKMTTVGGEGIGFEVEGINEEYLNYMSSRSKQVEDYLDKKGLTRETASAAQKQEAVLATRKAKGSQDHNDLKQKWNDDALAHGVILEAVINKSMTNEALYSQRYDEKATAMANKSVKFAISKLEERSSSFTRDALIAEAKSYSQMNTNEKAILEAIDAAELAQEIQFKYMRTWNFEKATMEDMPSYATKFNIQTELKLLDHAESLSKKGTQLMNKVDAMAFVKSLSENEKAAGRYAFNQQQIDATTNILSSKSSINLLQGLAGTSKTNSVLLTLSNEYKKQGYEVIGLAPTGAAAATLSEALTIEGRTLASYLKTKQDMRTGKGRVVILDEASLAGGVDMAELLKVTDKFNDKIILTGDTNQLSSVPAGNAFRQLQEAGYQTEKLEIIVRQTNAELLQAVYDAKDGKAAEALSNLEMIESEKPMDRLRMMSERFMSLNQDERVKTLMLVTGKDDAQELNKLVRAEMINRNELGHQSVEFDVLKKRDITETETKEARFYRETDFIEFNKNYTKIAVNDGDVGQVVSKDEKKNTITVKMDGGREVTFNPKQLTKYAVFEKDTMELRVGDKVMRNGSTKDQNEKNGNEFEILEVDQKNQTVSFREGKELKTVHVNDLKKVQHNYVMTSFPAQGKTYKRVFAHAESHRVNLMNKTTFYVQLSRAKSQAVIFTDSKLALTAALNQRDGKKYTALEGLQPKASSIAEDKSEVVYSKENKDEGKDDNLLKAKSHAEFDLISKLNKVEKSYLDKAAEIQKLERELRTVKSTNESKALEFKIKERRERELQLRQNIYEINNGVEIGLISKKEADKQIREVTVASYKPTRKLESTALQENKLKLKIETEKLKLKAIEISLKYSADHRDAREVIAKSKNEEAGHKAPFIQDNYRDKTEKDQEKVKDLGRFENNVDMQRKKVYALSIAAANARPTQSLRGSNRSSDPLKRIKYNMNNMKHNQRVVKEVVRKAKRYVDIAYNVTKLNFMEMRLKYSRKTNEARTLREEFTRAKWDRQASSTIQASRDSIKPVKMVDHAAQNLKDGNRVEVLMNRMSQNKPNDEPKLKT